MRFCFYRWLAILRKEFIHMRRDMVTIGMIVITPLIQLILFGYAINLTPRNLPTVIISQDHSMLTRQFIAGIENTKYFKIVNGNATESEAKKLLAQSKALFVINIPADFSHNLIAGHKPKMLVTVDATDPTAPGSAVSALKELSQTVFNLPFSRGLSYLKQSDPPFDLVIHNQYNPESITQYNIVPALIGVVLTMSSVMITSLAIIKERERGTMENLLATPLRPFEVMLGKIIPYTLVCYLQLFLIWLAAQLLFSIPLKGSIILLIFMTFPFILANLTVGLTFSTIAKNQLQAMQMTVFFFIPSLLLSGFMFPFFGMPKWAQYLGNILPLTHFNRIVRGILLKNNSFIDLWPHIWPLLLFILVSGWIAVKRYRQKLD